NLILINANAQLTGGLHPIEIDAQDIAVASDYLGELPRDLRHFFLVRSDNPPLQRPAHGRSELEWRHACYEIRKPLREQRLQLALNAIARFEILRNQYHLGEKRIGELRVER